jgi:hypothetical protein
VPTPTATPSPTVEPLGSANAKDYGARADGVTDDTAHILAAIAAAHGAPVYFPAGTYYIASGSMSGLTIPDGAKLIGPTVSALAYPTAGCETPTAWLKGKVFFGSNQTFTGLKIGEKGYSTRNALAATARNTSFIRCQFRGGGGDSKNGPVILINDSSTQSASHITFTDCNIECNAGNTTGGDMTRDYNNVKIFENAAAGGAHAEYITFDGCHFGVSNGVRTGCPRMDLEVYTDATPTAKNWNDITITDCVFEVSDWYNIDLSTSLITGTTDQGTGTNLISGCLLKGADTYSLCLESPQGVEVTGNTIRRGGHNTIKYGRTNIIGAVLNSSVHDNIIDLSTDNGFPIPTYQFYIRSGYNSITNNTILASAIPDSDSYCIFGFDGGHHSTITGNTIEVTGLTRLHRFSDITGDGHDNKTDPNTWVD